MSNKYLTVTALTKYIKRKIDMDPHLRDIWLKGEISNFKHHNRGHMYLTIKDNQTRIQAVMFAGNNRSLKFMPENGMHVLIRGEISVFEGSGQYQLYIQQMEPDGIGSLYLAFEQLKEKLNNKGYFDALHKKQIPLFPQRIGVITSPTGAAVRDIITTIRRRYPIVEVNVIPVLVQGPNAATSIVQAIKKANDMKNCDVLIVGRGGGSIEELWSFNEEIVAEAIFYSEIPIISAVGHETDTTISDYVADLRAPTPTGAAELAVPSQHEIFERIAMFKRTLTHIMNNHVHHHSVLIKRINQAYAFRYPVQLIRQKEQELDKGVERLDRAFTSYLNRQNDRIKSMNLRLVSQHPKQQISQSMKAFNQIVKQKNQWMSQILERKANQLTSSMDKLTLLNPLQIMQRGFAIPYSSKGELIRSSKQVLDNERITVKIADGELDCQVIEVREDSNDYNE